MERDVRAIRNALALRAPQEAALGLLDSAVGPLMDLTRPLDEKLAFVQGLKLPIESFERDFPNLCFEIATGVGKTRLMGAMMTLLYRTHGVRHFMILAPNLTIYEKLKRDLQPENPKYVFCGISDFAVQRPMIVTGDDYAGRNIDNTELPYEEFRSPIIVNLFNIAKVTGEMRGGNVPKIRRLSEYLGRSYFDYLAALPDLVLIMDEAHRYRASGGMEAISGLKPRIGIELTATAKRGNQAFRNVVYSYPLGAAMQDGFVKEPTAVTRKNIHPEQLDLPTLEKIKLEDGIAVHEDVKLQLDIYSRDTGAALVKPFMLVVAQTTVHAEELLKLIESDAFFEGRYRGKAITVHSNQSGALADETLERLLKVEDRTNRRKSSSM